MNTKTTRPGASSQPVSGWTVSSRGVMSSWRASGGEPNIAASLISKMGEVGMQVIETRPLIFSVRPAHFAWAWPASFVVVIHIGWWS